MNEWTYIWLGIMVILVMIEAGTMGLTTIWFALGALMALIFSLFTPAPAQIFVFIAVSALALVLLRPLAKRHMSTRKTRTNADRVLDMVGIVTETVNNVEATGVVHIGGRDWTARSVTGRVIEEGAQVRVHFIEGVKIIVEELGQPASRTP